MKTLRNNTLLAALSLVLPTVAFAGDDKAAVQPVTAGAHYKALNDIIGADVRLQASAEDRQEAIEDGEVAKGPKATIDDLILRPRDGRIEAAVLTFGGFIGIGDKTVALPISRLTWNETSKMFHVNATEEQLKKLPAFDLGDARERGLDNAYVTVSESWKVVGFPKDGYDDSMGKRAVGGGDVIDTMDREEEARLVGTKCSVFAAQHICASEVKDLKVHAPNSDATGSIEKCIVNCDTQKIEFAVIDGLGEGEYLVPREALVICQSGDEAALCFTHPVSSLTTAVRYSEPDNGVLTAADASAAKRWCELQPKTAGSATDKRSDKRGG